MMRLAVTCCCVCLLGCGPEATRGPRQKIDAAERARLRCDLAIFDGHDGTRLTWAQLLDAAADAEAVIVGEEHDDAVGHAVQLALVEDVFDRSDGCALCMEMLDRGEQATVDDYLADIIDRETFIERTASTRWRKISREFLDRKIDRRDFEKRIRKIGWPDWEGNYQPIVDAAKEHSGTVVAANTPWARYASLANKKGYEHLSGLTPSQRALFEIPHAIPEGEYRERFWEVIADRKEGEAPSTDGESDEGSEAAHPSVSDETVLGMFRAQLVMDATMAASIAAALRNGAVKVVHLVGQFHSDFEGGLIQELRHRRPGVQLLTISMQNRSADTLGEEDRGRADIVIYTRRPETMPRGE